MVEGEDTSGLERVERDAGGSERDARRGKLEGLETRSVSAPGRGVRR